MKWAGISGVEDQGECAVSWAISAVQIFRDRGVVRNQTLLGVSEENLLEKAGTGCAGDSPYFAWKLLGRELEFPDNELAIQNEILNNGPVQGKSRNWRKNYWFLCTKINWSCLLIPLKCMENQEHSGQVQSRFVI